MRKRQSIVLLFCLLIMSLFLNSCLTGRPRKYIPKVGEAPKEESTRMPRADPAYMQYLERQSMLGQSYNMAQVVSGSELAWRESASSGTPDAMLGFADNWLFVHPLTILNSTRNSTFSQLTDATTWPLLREAGIKGIYVAPIQGGGALWAKERRTVDTGEDVVQYSFSKAAGSEDQYKRLMGSIIDNHGLLGSDLVPAATGLGPDFFLAARGVREYPGIYCMVEIPEKDWTSLPAVAAEWEGTVLNQAQVAELSSKGFLPKAMRDEVSPLGRSGGWAATGQIRGVDGNYHRWVYRYYHTPYYAVLNWEDPSQTAHRILSGSAVRQVGLQGQALLGLRFEAFQGLEAAPAGVQGNSFSIEPALTAAASLSRELRRYGGWSWVRDDDLPLTSVSDFLRSGVDFIHDSAFSPASEHALLTGDATLLRYMADELIRLGIDTRRLVHTTPAQDGLNYSLPHLSYLAARSGNARAAAFRNSIQAAMRNAVSHVSPTPVKDGYLYTTSAGLAAMALKSSDAKAIAKGHSLLIFFKAMQPGVLMLSGQDIAGVMPLSWDSMQGAAESWDVSNTSRGAYAMTTSASTLAVTLQGMARAPRIYPVPDAQVHQKDSFVHRIGSFTRPRTDYGIARGVLVARPKTKGKGSIALLTRLPDGKSYLLSVCNFSRSSVTETVSLAGQPGIAAAMSRVTSIATGGSHSVSGSTVTVQLAPWEGRALLLGSGAPAGQPA
ncbi:hypothetical protein LJC59_07010, partial [Desulfovibrio sp. OttesenSCG-928-A18]|nr:hypothetical protein [Desulfovibrio sp. OttesenSCG-928-A18]